MKIHPPSILVGLLIGSVITWLLMGSLATDTSEDQENKPLYWVAPMDSNYRRDKPGKSPMGMDLVPVYAEDTESLAPGVIQLTPEVIHNIGVKTTSALRIPLNRSLTTMGVVSFDQDKMIHIHPRMEGWIEKLHVKSEGETVDANQPLYDIYSPALVNAQEELLLALKRNNTSLIDASTQRLIALQLPQSSIDAIKRNRKIQTKVTFYAPHSGVIDQLLIREGMYVKPTTTMMSIAQMDQVWVEAEILAAQSDRLLAGANIQFQSDFHPGKVWQGKVDYIYPTLDPKNRTIRFRSNIVNESLSLKPNMFVSLQIENISEQNVLAIPSQSVIKTGSQDRVVVALGDGRFKSVEVQLGQEGNQHVEVLSGLRDGDEIVSSALFLLDSESSPNSDFKRMTHVLKPDSSATVTGVIESIDRSDFSIQVYRDAIEKWGRPAASVNFNVDSHIGMHNYQVGDSIKFSFFIDEGTFTIADMQLLSHNSGDSL